MKPSALIVEEKAAGKYNVLDFLDSSRRHLSHYDCLEDKRGKLSELFCTALCRTVVHNDTHTRMSSS